MDLYESTLKEPIVRQFLQRHHLDASFVKENFIEFLNWTEAMEKCQGCQGLDFCRQPFRGCVYDLDVDEKNNIIDSYQPCAFEKDKRKALHHQNKYWIAHMDISDYLIDLNTIPLQNESKRYVEVWGSVSDSLNSQKGLYIYGQVGTGKSYLMKGVCNYYAKAGQRVSFVKVPLLIREIKESFGSSQELNISYPLRHSDVVVFDDMGSESMSAWTTNDVLFPILDYRMEHHLKTYFTSNYSFDELKPKYAAVESEGRILADRLIERIKTLSDPVLLSGKSRR